MPRERVDNRVRISVEARRDSNPLSLRGHSRFGNQLLLGDDCLQPVQWLFRHSPILAAAPGEPQAFTSLENYTHQGRGELVGRWGETFTGDPQRYSGNTQRSIKRLPLTTYDNRPTVCSISAPPGKEGILKPGHCGFGRLTGVISEIYKR